MKKTNRYSSVTYSYSGKKRSPCPGRKFQSSWSQANSIQQQQQEVKLWQWQNDYHNQLMETLKSVNYMHTQRWSQGAHWLGCYYSGFFFFSFLNSSSCSSLHFCPLPSDSHSHCQLCICKQVHGFEGLQNNSNQARTGCVISLNSNLGITERFFFSLKILKVNKLRLDIYIYIFKKPLFTLVSARNSLKMPVVTLALVNAQWSRLLRTKTHWCALRPCFRGSIQTRGKDKMISDCDRSLSQL